LDDNLLDSRGSPSDPPGSASPATMAAPNCSPTMQIRADLSLPATSRLDDTRDNRTKSRLADTRDTRTSAARREAWLEHVPSASTYDAVALAKTIGEAVKSDSSAKLHKAKRDNYLAFCGRVGVNPQDVSASTSAHVAIFYKSRTKNFKLGLSTSKHISAQMTLYFKELGWSGLWWTGKVGEKDVCVNGNPNYSDDVAKCTRAHQAGLAAQGRVPVAVSENVNIGEWESNPGLPRE